LTAYNLSDRMLRLAWIGVLVACAAAQTPALKNTGKPMQVAAECSLEDMQALALTCPADRPCPVYLELSGVESSGRGIFVTGNLHTEVTTLSSILLASGDGGQSWTEPYERMRGAGLDLIQFIDVSTGWVAGESLSAIPRDPFLLATSDGGKTWDKRPVFGESRTGTIDFFHFDSEKLGKLWVGQPFSGAAARFEAYESHDGGATWVLEEAGEGPPGRGSRSAGDYRLRTDAATHSYVVDRRSPGGWETVASFLVDAGQCRAPEVVLQPEPTPQP
jgi:hypothetical protein